MHHTRMQTLLPHSRHVEEFERMVENMILVGHFVYWYKVAVIELISGCVDVKSDDVFFFNIYLS